MPLRIHIPDACSAERRYTVSLVFDEFLGIPVEIASAPRRDVMIEDSTGRQLVFSDEFFSGAARHWFGAESLPRRPLAWVALPPDIDSDSDRFCGPRLPVVFGTTIDGRVLRHESPQRIECSIDILGSVFFLVSRYEEVAAPVADEHGRFPAAASLAYQEGFLDRPVVDEYVELLWQLMRRLWPGLRRKRQRYQLLLSHDVDSPYQVLGRSLVDNVKGLSGDLLLRKDVRKAGRRAWSAIQACCGLEGADPYNSFAYIMSACERHSVATAFYFITRRRLGRRDGTYHFDTELIQRLVSSIFERGHQVGLHPSYATFDHTEQLAEELAILRRCCAVRSIRQSTWGGRQHYLRWKNPITWRSWNDAGLDYDATLGYADDVGFRCGTCREYPVYDLASRCALQLRERPLIAMECALSFCRPEPSQSCLRRVATLVDRCRRVRGNFSLLWHNNNLVGELQRQCFEEILQYAA